MKINLSESQYMEPTTNLETNDSGQFRLTPEEAQSRYQIKNGAYYKRLEAAGIKHRKDENGVFLDKEQVAILDELDEHIKNGGRLDDFAPNKLLVINQKPKEIINAESVIEESFNEINLEFVKQLDRSAQSVAASFLADARNRLTAEYLENPERIDNDLKEQVFINPSPRGVDKAWAGHHIAAAINRIKAQGI
jgi:hypothetical protein